MVIRSSEDEELLIRWLEDHDIPVILALTKADKFKPMQRAKRVKILRDAARLPTAQVIVTSAEKGIGIDELWQAIDEYTTPI